MLAKVTIIGVKPAFQHLVDISKWEPRLQRLYLVADVNNRFDRDAVMLHDGVNKLGRVVAKQAPAIREFLDAASLDRGQDQVIVCELGELIAPDGVDPDSVWASSVCVAGRGLVYERIARKNASVKTPEGYACLKQKFT
jgi:hypothetical protein